MIFKTNTIFIALESIAALYKGVDTYVQNRPIVEVYLKGCPDSTFTIPYENKGQFEQSGEHLIKIWEEYIAKKGNNRNGVKF